jgi:hypothetical protein
MQRQDERMTRSKQVDLDIAGSDVPRYSYTIVVVKVASDQSCGLSDICVFMRER